jgi:predicted dehydrogenase
MSDFGVDRRGFLGAMGVGSVGALLAGAVGGRDVVAAESAPRKQWKPVSDRKVRVGIVGYGYCKFGAKFGFQDHPNVEIVAVSDLIPERRAGLMKACRCATSYESLEVLVKDPKIEAVFVATDAPSHARHSVEALTHGKHVMSAVPATYGSVEEGEKLLEAVRKTGLKYMMAETSFFREDCWSMRQIYRAGGFGRLVYSEGEYFHHMSKPLPSYKNWRTGSPPMWYPTHSTAYYIGVTGKRFTAVSCGGFRAGFDTFKPGANAYNNEFTDEIALFQTSEGGTSRQCMCKSVVGYHAEAGRVFGEKGCMDGTKYQGRAKKLGDLRRPALPPGVAGGGHGGSHGLLMDEFITSILADRQPLVNVYESLAMTVPGIIAHQSAIKGGEMLKVPQYLPPKS